MYMHMHMYNYMLNPNMCVLRLTHVLKQTTHNPNAPSATATSADTRRKRGPRWASPSPRSENAPRSVSPPPEGGGDYTNTSLRCSV